MDFRLFESKLSNHEIFNAVKNCLNTSDKVLKNLIAVKDDIFYIWHSDDNSLLSLNLKNLEDENAETTHQKLYPTCPPQFSVERVMVDACGTKVCVWGSGGVVIIELPSRWNKGGRHDDGKDTILCKSFALEERFLYQQGDVRRVHWHPDSISHLLVLMSDNTIRLYSTSKKLIKVLNIGPKPSGLLSGRRILESLGDTAVDFTVLPDSNTLLILRGNGDVYMMKCDLDSKSPLPPKLVGPLTMYPPADDNYGEESCSITALGGKDIPPVVVIATSGALLYHCLLLPEPNNEEFDESASNQNEVNYVLYVVEAVELNIVLNLDHVDVQCDYPVHLYPAESESSSYACVHAAGVHIVTLPLVYQIKQYILTDDADITMAVEKVCGTRSIVKYSVCTHGPNSKFVPPIGVAITPAPLPTLLVLCSDAQIITRLIEPYGLDDYFYKELQLKNPALDSEEIQNILKERQKLSFTTIIQEMLNRDVSLPLLKLDTKDEPSPKESLEFLTQATLKLRQEYICRQSLALGAIRKKVHSLYALNKQQREWYNDLEKDIDEVQTEASVLREKCIQAEEQQEDIKRRCYNARRLLRASASITHAERDALATLKNHNNKAIELKKEVERLKERAAGRSQELKEWEESYKKKDIALGKSHSDTISHIFQQQTRQISKIIDETKHLKEELNIV